MPNRVLPVRAKTHQTLLELHQGDITEQDTDAIVNAANAALIPGGGVDGAINRAAGPQLGAAMAALGGCPTGDARITPGYNLKARYVIHAVGPIYHQAREAAPELLASAHRRSLELAVENGLQSIAFPAISTGVYGYPVGLAAPVALETCYRFVRGQEQIRLVRFVLFSGDALEAFAIVLDDLVTQHDDLSYT